MTKERRSVTLPPEVDAYLGQDGVNASELVSHLVKLEMGEDVVNEQILTMRMEMEKDRYEDAAQKARGHLERHNTLKDRLEEESERTEDILEDAAETLRPQQLTEDNPAVEQYSNEAGMDTETFIQEMEDRL